MTPKIQKSPPEKKNSILCTHYFLYWSPQDRIKAFSSIVTSLRPLLSTSLILSSSAPTTQHFVSFQMCWNRPSVRESIILSWINHYCVVTLTQKPYYSFCFNSILIFTSKHLLKTAFCLFTEGRMGEKCSVCWISGPHLRQRYHE